MTHSDHDPDVQAEVIKDLTEHIVELEEQLDKHKESLRDLEARLQKAEQRASQAETAAGDCKFQNERLVDRVKQAEEALRHVRNYYKGDFDANGVTGQSAYHTMLDVVAKALSDNSEAR